MLFYDLSSFLFIYKFFSFSLFLYKHTGRKNHTITSIDAEMAFDKNTTFIHNNNNKLRKTGIEVNCLNLMESILKTTTKTIQLTSHLAAEHGKPSLKDGEQGNLLSLHT